MKTTKEKLDTIAKKDGRFSPDAIKFVYEGLSYTGKNIVVETGHVSGKQLCEGLRRLAVEKWGRLAKLVLNEWDIKTTRDFGEIVYLMIRHKWMSAQPADTIDDFDNVYDFDEVFKNQFRFN
ncbi:MAG: hypothetical protein PHF37_08250 [Phycisphaerae bacterium]|nr:hypothetical protein [Phycisphaerae bacterium]